MDYVAGSELSSTSDRLKGMLRVDLSPRWTCNGTVAVPVENTYPGDTTTCEAEVQCDVSPKMQKRIVVSFFTRPANFGVQNVGGVNNFQSFGAGIVYKTTFDRFSEIFKKDEESTPVIVPEFDAEPPSLFDLPVENDSILQ